MLNEQARQTVFQQGWDAAASGSTDPNPYPWAAEQFPIWFDGYFACGKQPTVSRSVPVGLAADSDVLLARPAHLITEAVAPDQFLISRMSHCVIDASQPVSVPQPTLITNGIDHLDLTSQWHTPIINGRMPEDLSAVDSSNILSPVVRYPDMIISKLNNVFCLPHGVLILPTEKIFISDYLTRNSPYFQPWMTYKQENRYAINVSVETANEIEGDYLYLDHAIIHHFGHFISDCLSRLWAWNTLRELGCRNLRLVVGHKIRPFARDLLRGFGVKDSDVVELADPVVFRNLYVSTPGFAPGNYTSPSANVVWNQISGGLPAGDDYPRLLYVSRSQIDMRPLTNETEVERLFERRGFTVIHPQMVPVREQVGLFANAELIAGTGGSGLYNLAFQQKLRSVFLLASDAFITNSELLFCAFHDVTVHYFVGKRAEREPSYAGPPYNLPWSVDEKHLSDAVDAWLDEVLRATSSASGLDSIPGIQTSPHSR